MSNVVKAAKRVNHAPFSALNHFGSDEYETLDRWILSRAVVVLKIYSI